MITKQNILEAVKLLGIDKKPVCIHASLRSFGKIENGADTIIDAFADCGCTVMAPAFSHKFDVAPVKGLKPIRNGVDYTQLNSEESIERYTVECNEIDLESMGRLPATLLLKKDRIRGENPLNSFAAVGESAEELIKSQTPEKVYAPFEKLCELKGYVLLMGVGLDKATIIHYAEVCAGRTPFVRWAKNKDGETISVSIGSCSRGFENFKEILKPLEKTVTVGGSNWICYPAAEMVYSCKEAIINQPEITRCSHLDCIRCQDAIAGGPVWDAGFDK